MCRLRSRRTVCKSFPGPTSVRVHGWAAEGLRTRPGRQLDRDQQRTAGLGRPAVIACPTLEHAGPDLFLIALQAFGSAIQGIGFAALRLRTNTIWPLIVIHMLHDLFLQMSTLPIPLLEAFIETILCIYGMVLLRHLKV
jgi:hypothetical protein